MSRYSFMVKSETRPFHFPLSNCFGLRFSAVRTFGHPGFLFVVRTLSCRKGFAQANCTCGEIFPRARARKEGDFWDSPSSAPAAPLQHGRAARATERCGEPEPESSLQASSTICAASCITRATSAAMARVRDVQIPQVLRSLRHQV